MIFRTVLKSALIFLRLVTVHAFDRRNPHR